jgi:hypothetical protein
MRKHNFIWDIFLDYQKNKRGYCLWRWCTTCGNYKIRDKLFLNSIDELGINFEQTGMREGFLSIQNIRQRELYNKVVELICQKLNGLDNKEIDTMLSPIPFYELDHNRDDFLKFIIMEIYESLETRLSDRKEVMNHLGLLLTNKKISDVVMKMNSRYLKSKQTQGSD